MSGVGEKRVELNQEERKITEPRNILITDKWRCRLIAVLDLKMQLGWGGSFRFVASLSRHSKEMKHVSSRPDTDYNNLFTFNIDPFLHFRGEKIPFSLKDSTLTLNLFSFVFLS